MCGILTRNEPYLDRASDVSRSASSNITDERKAKTVTIKSVSPVLLSFPTISRCKKERENPHHPERNSLSLHSRHDLNLLSVDLDQARDSRILHAYTRFKHSMSVFSGHARPLRPVHDKG